MLPSTWLSLVLFILLIAPGLLFDLLAEGRRVGVKESAFRETGRVVLASLGFSTVGVVAVALVRTVHAPWMPDPRLLLLNSHMYLAAHYTSVFWALLLEGAVALAASAGVHAYLTKNASGPPLRATSLWSAALSEALPAGTVAHARVRLESGAVYLGQVVHYTADLELADRELVLGPPLFSKTGDRPLEPVPDVGRVILVGSRIESIGVEYRREA
jgi:hypothetical protein